ncbi:hypothetical protein [Ruegeria pomeroyi]|uniref:hypothetical protein n=1 Tax=Ruegeria pomeroyi TaxID=89184 RepID=UPI001F276183|nr:hypothetical protein [Ruegeria pomeroyi]
MGAITDTAAGLWLAVVGSGLYHGLNPGMGWPLAVSAALMEGRSGALGRALVAIALGHLAAMLAILMPFAVMTLLIDWQREIRLGAGLVVIALGVWIFVSQRHPRFLARVRPGRLALWSFLVALAHGAALMLVPIYLGLCRADELDTGHAAAGSLMSRGAAIAITVALVHTAAMIAAGGAAAWAVYRWLGLSFLSKSWFNLDRVWAASLVLVGVIALATA